MINNKAKIFLIICLLIFIVGCGDALNTGDYQGEPAYIVGGLIQSLEPAKSNNKTYLAFAWVNWAKPEDTIEVQLATVTSTTFPISFELALFDNPPQAALNRFVSESNPEDEVHVGTGIIFVFNDKNNNESYDGSFEEPEPDSTEMLGISYSYAVLYVGIEDLNAKWLKERVINSEEIKPGFNLVKSVCDGEQQQFNPIRVVPEEEVVIESAFSDEEYCFLNFF